ncbi:Aste57867_501 [Aphanomyces stellatus]|uniref:Aste57867_501 protein n=1 Tax=Aphanomyces stellatus TaxID=120398 RepID=A0A485K3S4_9STRA|nr:hypothetical protein As57867_000500 [Aphanomyces stellatus]VFT77726.1 Aste57867_501 [Aphanomyces stellatus]
MLSILSAGPPCPMENVPCLVNNQCVVLNKQTNAISTAVWNADCIGNLTALNKSSMMKTLTFAGSGTLSLTLMQLPHGLDSLTIASYSQLVLDGMLHPLPSDLRALTIVNISTLEILPFNFSWPSNMTRVTISGTSLQNIPSTLPPNMTSIDLQRNYLFDFTNLPPTVTNLNVANNAYAQIRNVDLTHLESLNLSSNPLRTFVNVRLSRRLLAIDFSGCQLTNVTIDNSTFDALKALSSWTSGAKGFRADNASAITTCTNGRLETLWPNQTQMPLHVCVLADAPNRQGIVPPVSNFHQLSSSSAISTTTLALLVTALVVATATLVGYCRWRRQQAQDESDADVASWYSDMSDSNVHLDVRPLRPVRIPADELVFVSQIPLASGAFGEVFLGTYRGERVAIKRLKSSELTIEPTSEQTTSIEQRVQSFVDELVLHIDLDCVAIVKFIGASWRTPVDMAAVMEYMDQGDLRTYLGTPTVFPWGDKAHGIRRVLQGLSYLHTRDPPIIHRDLKSHNILLDATKGTKITDFGVSRRVPRRRAQLTSGVGTSRWMAPEVMVGNQYSVMADVFSFGIVLSEYSTHSLPYTNMVNPKTGHPYTEVALLHAVPQEGLVPVFETEETPPWVLSMAAKCLARNPAQRPTARALLEMLPPEMDDE